MSSADEIQVEDLCSEKKFFNQVPNIIYRMGLGCHIIAYYGLLKSVAGDRGSCFMTQKTIAERLGCSERQVRKMNAFMAKPFEILGGKPLIRVSKQKSSDGGCKPNLVQIVDIWVENVMVLNSKIYIPLTPMPIEKKKIKEKNGAAPDSAPPAPDSAPPAPGATKEEPSYKNPVKKMYFKDLGPETLALDKSNSKTLDVTRRWGLTEEQSEVFYFLKSCNIDAEDKKLCYWAKKYSLQRLMDVFNESKANKAKSLRKYMSKLLDGESKVPNANAHMNKEFLREYLKVNPWPGAKIFKEYVKLPIGEDYLDLSFHLASYVFIEALTEKHINI